MMRKSKLMTASNTTSDPVSWTLAKRIFLGYGVVLFTFSSVSIYSLVALHSIGREIRLVSSGYLPLAKAVAQIESFHQNRLRDSNRLLEEKQPEIRRTLAKLARMYFPIIIRKKIASTADILKKHRNNAPVSERHFLDNIHSRLGDLSDFYEEYERAYQSLFILLQQSEKLSRSSLPVRRVSSLEQRIDREIKVLNIMLDQRVADRVRSAEKMERQSVWTIVALSLMAIALALLATFAGGRLLAPIHTLTSGVTRIGMGDFSAQVPLTAKNEIGILAREFNAMAKALRERQSQLDEKQQALVRAERLAAIGRISAQITHEIRNPLCSLGLNAEMLEEVIVNAHFANPAQKEETQQLVASIVREADRLTEITEQYLAFARFPKPVLVALDPNAMMESLLDFLEEELARAGVRMEKSLAPQCPAIVGDAGQIRQALMNLLRNSREAMVHGGTVRVETRPLVTHVEISVSDTGPGIPAEKLSKLFDPFFSTKERGTGLGLALTQQIIHEHGGEISCESELGKGTRFFLRLRRAIT